MQPSRKELKARMQKSYHLLCCAQNGEYGEEGKIVAAEFIAEQQRAHRIFVGVVIVAGLIIFGALIVSGVIA